MNPKCCNDFVVAYAKLLFPYNRTPEEQKFLDAHGVLSIPLKDLQVDEVNDLFVKVTHRCNRLTPEGLCSIYPERPEVCRLFDCKTRKDCACNERV